MEEEKHKSICFSSFISANSACGFSSLYDTVFDPCKFDRIFVIVGGPGTGKSTLMRRLSGAAAEHGAKCEEILCSSDPSSLDGVILEANGKRVGVFDGTAPHARSLSAPGYIEELWNPGNFWNGAALQEKKDILISASEEKKLAFAGAYRFLSAMGEVHKERHLFWEKEFDEEKAKRQIRHKTHLLKETGEQKKRFLRAFSTLGEYVLPFPEGVIDNALLISGTEAPAEIYLTLFAKILQEKGIKHIAYLSPLCPEYTEGVYLPENKTLLIKEALYHGNAPSRRIVAERFFRDGEHERKEAISVYEGLKLLALSRLSTAGNAHLLLEEIYKQAMDFSALQAESKKMCKTLLSALLLQ